MCRQFLPEPAKTSGPLGSRSPAARQPPAEGVAAKSSEQVGSGRSPQGEPALSVAVGTCIQMNSL